MFAWTGLHAEKSSLVEHATFADGLSTQFAANQAERQDLINHQFDDMLSSADDISRISDKMREWQQSSATDYVNDLNNRLNKSATEEASENNTSSTSNIDWNSLANTVGNSNSGSSSGGKAVKTTSTDKNLLSDDDIQLLMDVATRDYKLNYQQVTPNITLTFGDIRETADVDNILEQVADRLEEIYDGNLEVAK